MKKTVLAMALMTCLAAHGQEKWTLRQCIDYAMQNNITLKQSQVKRAISTETRKASEAALLPSLSASTNQTLGYRPWTESGTVTVNNGTVSSKVHKTYYNGTYGINAQWTVWNGNKNHNQVKLDRLSEEQANLTVQETANTIQEKIADLYVQVLYTNEAIAVNELSLEASRKNEERGQQMVQVGKMSKADLAQLSSQRATDEYNLIAAKTDLADCKLQLKQLLEITGEQEFDVALPTADDAQALADIPDLLSVYEAALAQRPEIKNAELALQASDVQRKIARAGYMPTISMTGGVGTSTSTNNANEWGQQMVRVGKMSKADLAQLSSQRATDEYNLIAAKTDLADRKLQLKQLLEITGEQEFDVALPTADDAQALADIPDLLSVYEAALAQRPEIKNAELALQASDVQRKIARAGYMPTISMTGGVGTSTSTNNANEWGQQMKTNFDASAGVGVSVPIFDQRKTRTAINKANLQREEALLNMESKRKTIYQNVEGYWLDAQSYQQKFRAAIANVESETQSYSLLSEQFELGLKNIVELMTGKARLVKAQQNMLQSKYMTILSLQMLKFYRGEEITI